MQKNNQSTQNKREQQKQRCVFTNCIFCGIIFAKRFIMQVYDENAEVLWEDRKRWCGLPISFTRYSIIRKEGDYAKLICTTGLFTSRTEEINLYRVDDLGVYVSLFDKMFGVGTITVYCRDASCDKLDLMKVKNPYKVRTLLNNLVIEDRKRVGVRQTEMQF
jgi:hypothetical protein